MITFNDTSWATRYLHLATVSFIDVLRTLSVNKVGLGWHCLQFIHFHQENAFKNVVWKMAAILSQPQCVKALNSHKFFMCWTEGDMMAILTHCGQVTRICVSKLSHHWFRSWFGACSAPNHDLNLCKMRPCEQIIQEHAFKMSSAKWRSFRPGLNALKHTYAMHKANTKLTQRKRVFDNSWKCQGLVEGVFVSWCWDNILQGHCGEVILWTWANWCL